MNQQPVSIIKSQAPVAQLIAKQAITEQLYTYCRAMDRIDNALGVSVWHAEGTADYGAIFKGTGAGFIDFVSAAHRGLIAHSHQISNIIIKLGGSHAASESQAASEAYVTATLRLAGKGGKLSQMTSYGRYLDRWSQREGRWAIDHRVYVHDFDEQRDIVSTGFPGWGTRDPSDPSYDVLGSVP